MNNSILALPAKKGRPEKGGLPSRELQELWFATRRRGEWRTLVVAPASPGLSAVPIAQALGEVGSAIRMSPVQFINAEGMGLDQVALLVTEEMSADLRPAGSVWTSGTSSGPGEPVGPAPTKATIVAIDPVMLNPLVLPLALAADAVLLCVAQGLTEIASARHTIDLIGTDRIIGSVLLVEGKR